MAKNSHEQFMITHFNILAFVISLSNLNIFLFEKPLAVFHTILAEMLELPEKNSNGCATHFAL